MDLLGGKIFGPEAELSIWNYFLGMIFKKIWFCGLTFFE